MYNFVVKRNTFFNFGNEQVLMRDIVGEGRIGSLEIHSGSVILVAIIVSNRARWKTKER